MSLAIVSSLNVLLNHDILSFNVSQSIFSFLPAAYTKSAKSVIFSVKLESLLDLAF